MMAKRYEIPQRTKLCGGFNCELTPEEANRWHEFLDTHPAWQRYLQLQSECDACGLCITGGAIEREAELIDRADHVRKALGDMYAVGKEWFEALCAKTPEKQDAYNHLTE
jgi:hypothetical protein